MVLGIGFQSVWNVHGRKNRSRAHRSRLTFHTCWFHADGPHGAGVPLPAGLHDTYVPVLNVMNTSLPSTRGVWKCVSSVPPASACSLAENGSYTTSARMR